MKSPNEAEYCLWEERVLNDIDKAYNKLSELQTLKKLIFARCVILTDDREVDYELSLNLWHSKRAEIADQALSNIQQPMHIVSDVKLKPVKLEIKNMIMECQHGCEIIQTDEGKTYHTKPPSAHPKSTFEYGMIEDERPPGIDARSA